MRYNIEETAVYGKYVRWCGRTGPRGPSYPIQDLISWTGQTAYPTNTAAASSRAAAAGWFDFA